MFITIWISYLNSILKLSQGIVKEESIFSSKLNRLEWFQTLSKADEVDYCLYIGFQVPHPPFCSTKHCP